MENLWPALIGLVVGAAAAWVKAVLAIREKTNEDLRARRLETYPVVWRETAALSFWPPGKLTRQDLLELKSRPARLVLHLGRAVPVRERPRPLRRAQGAHLCSPRPLGRPGGGGGRLPLAGDVQGPGGHLQRVQDLAHRGPRDTSSALTLVGGRSVAAAPQAARAVGCPARKGGGPRRASASVSAGRDAASPHRQVPVMKRSPPARGQAGFEGAGG
jgi:hypothetical protein